MNTTETHYTQEELYAMEQEGYTVATPELLELIMEYRELGRQKAKVDAAQKAISALVKEEAAKRNVKGFTYDGRTQFENVTGTKKEVNRDRLESLYPEVWADVVTVSSTTKVDFKK